MPTPSEQKALAFVAIVIVLGGTVRVLRASSPPTATAAEQQALARQASAAESAATGAQSRKSGRNRPRMTSRRLDTGAIVPETGLSPLGYPPPVARIDVDNRQPPRTAVSTPSQRPSGGSPPPTLLDLDIATAVEIELLPRVGPALAARIIASRDSLGPFGSLEALGRVRGIGPAMLRQLRARVTFSGRAASSGVRRRY